MLKHIGNKSRNIIAACAIAVAASGIAVAADWPNWRGPNHDQHAPDAKVSTSWPKEGPKELWRIKIGNSHGSFAVKNGKALLMMQRDGQDTCVAFDANTGKELWASPIDKNMSQQESWGGRSAHSTPAIDGDMVYCTGQYLKLKALNLNDGKVVWEHDLVSEFGGSYSAEARGIKEWGNAASPVVVGNHVIMAGGGAGQSILAFDKKSGAVVWKNHDEKITQATPTPATIHGVQQVVFFMQSGLVSVAADNGQLLWKHPHQYNVSTAASPVVAGDIVYASAAYQVGAVAVQIMRTETGLQPKELYKDRKLMNHWMTPLVHEGHLYGLFGHQRQGRAPVQCVELKTGKALWSEDGFGHGGLIYADGHLLIQGDKGQLVLAKATPEKYTEVARAQLFEDRCWNMPVIADGKVFTHSETEAVCLDISGK
jgi:outer membrane protein assembly factor BamB